MVKKSPHHKGLGHFCFCIGLRLGSILLTITWLLGGIASAVLFIKYPIYEMKKELTITLLMFSFSATIFAVYGLYALIIRKSDKSIRIYSNLSWVLMVLIWLILSLTMIASLTASYKTSLKDCRAFMIYKYPPKKIEGFCENRVKTSIIEVAVGTLTACLVNIYFSIMLRAYLARREHKARFKNRRDSLASTAVFTYSVKSDNLTNRSYSMDFESLLKKIKPKSLSSAPSQRSEEDAAAAYAEFVSLPSIAYKQNKRNTRHMHTSIDAVLETEEDITDYSA
ncbi:14310_t:CDS:2 [Ambispora leptoticha]|uniref:14310_t:CDS:1 n=1 Tax=Ambispora leptoticha TaxID=144679 RepID=A0A9N8Z5C9_9GLOM|nr:14310_t:CDS:2 [Ambispora leptoticha]